jgi:cellobiose dehydrogenase (acceptor)
MLSLSTTFHLVLLLACSLLIDAQNVASTSVFPNPSPPSTSSPPLSTASFAASSESEWWEKEWDVIVIGSGPAGIIGTPPFLPHSISLFANAGEAAEKCAAASANLSVLLLEAGGPSYSIVGDTDRPDWLSGANISRVDCPGLYNSIFDNSITSTQSLLYDGAVNAFGGCCVGGSSAINAGLYFAPPDIDWDSWGIASWSSANISQSAAALEATIGSGVSIPSTDGKRYLQSTYNAMSNWLSGAGYAEVDINSKANYNTKSKVSGLSFSSAQVFPYQICGTVTDVE